MVNKKINFFYLFTNLFLFINKIGTKLLFNAAISKNTIISKGGDKMIRLTCFNAADTVNNKDKNDLTPAIFMLKTKLSKESDDFYQAINKIIIKQNNE